MPKLTAVPKSDPPPAEKRRQRLVRMPKPAEMLECRCGSRELIAAHVGVMFKAGKASGGTKVLLCALCLMKGERVVVA